MSTNDHAIERVDQPHADPRTDPNEAQPRATADGDQVKILQAFLAQELTRKDGRQCERVTLSVADGGATREAAIKEWVRRDTPAAFELGRLEEMAIILVAEAEEYVDGLGNSCPRDGLRFVVRSHQSLGGRAPKYFRVKPSMEANPTALGVHDPSVYGVLAMQMKHNEKLIDHNHQMTRGTVGVLLDTQGRLQDENNELRAEVRRLNKDLDEAKNTDEIRLMEALSRNASDKRKDALVGRIMQLAPIVAAKFMGKDVGGSGLALMVVELADGIDTEKQLPSLLAALRPEQRLNFAAIVSLARSSAPPKEKIGEE